MLVYRDHGGGCCGYKHIFSFDYRTVEDLDRVLNEHFVPDNNNRVVEVILSERQVNPVSGDNRIPQSVREAGGWPAILAERGFRLVSRWRNSNSARNCYQFVKTNRWLSMTQRQLPFAYPQELVAFQSNGGENIDTNETVAPPPPPVPQQIYTTFHNVFRTRGRSEAGWPSRRLASEAAPRALRIDAKFIYSDGTIEWEENV